MAGQRRYESLDAESYANELGAIFVNTSSKENFGVKDLYQRVGERVLKFRETQAINGTSVGIPVTPGKTALHTAALSNGDSHSGPADRNPLLGSQGGMNGDNSAVDLSPYIKPWHDGGNGFPKTNDNYHPGFTENKGGTSSDLTGRRSGILSANRQPPPLQTENNDLGASAGETLPGIMCSESPMGCGMFTTDSNTDEALVNEKEVVHERGLEKNISSCCLS